MAKIKKKNQFLDVVIVTTKIGNTLIFDRLTGKSLRDINYINVPQSDYFAEQVSPKQLIIENQQQNSNPYFNPVLDRLKNIVIRSKTALKTHFLILLFPNHQHIP